MCKYSNKQTSFFIHSWYRGTCHLEYGTSSILDVEMAADVQKYIHLEVSAFPFCMDDAAEDTTRAPVFSFRSILL